MLVLHIFEGTQRQGLKTQLFNSKVKTDQNYVYFVKTYKDQQAKKIQAKPTIETNS